MQTRLRKTGLTASIAIITLAVILAIGSTFSLFTSNSGNNIDVNSAKVEVTTELDTLETYSLGEQMTGGKFANLGKAEIKGEDLEITNMTPGDEARVTVKINNSSTVLIAYRVKVLVNGALYEGIDADNDDVADEAPLVITVKQGDATLKLDGSYTDWAYTETIGADITDLDVSVLLPVEAGNVYQTENATVEFVVEAVQANAAQLIKVTTTDQLYAALETNGEAILLGDITLTDDITVKGNATLDLNGYALTGNIVNEGNLIIKDSMGAVTADASGETTESPSGKFFGSITITNDGALTIEGGSFTSSITNDGALTIEGGSFTSSITNDGALTIEGGSFTSSITNDGALTIEGGSFVGSINNNDTLTITGGTFENTGAAVIENVATATLVIEGGSFTSTTEDFAINYESAENITVSGGSFSGFISTDELAKLAGEGQGATVDSETGIVTFAPVAFKIGDAGYVTFADALMWAEEGDEIDVVSDITSVDGYLITDKNITLDLNGKTISVSDGASVNNRAFKINGSSVVTIKNGIIIADGTLTAGAYGAIRTEGAANVTLENLKLYNYRGGGLNVKAVTGTTVTINNCEIYSQYGGGVEASGGTIVLNDTKIEQKGVYTNGWYSVAMEINSSGKITVNSGEYFGSAIETDANAAMGNCVAFILSSGGTLDIHGGTFTGIVAETAAASNFCGLIYADRAAVVNIYGGTFNSNGAILDMRNNAGSQPNPKATLYGGTFSADPTVSGLYSSNLITVAEGYVLAEEDGAWKVGYRKVSTNEELAEVLQNGGKVELDGEFAVENFNSGIRGETTLANGTLTRGTADGNPLTVYNTTEKVTFDGVKFESVKGSAVIATRKDGSNMEFNNCSFDNFAAPSTGNTGIQVFAKDVTIVFNNCTFNNMPIVTSSSYAGTIKLEFNNCTFTWTGANCPGVVIIDNNITADLDFNDCTFAYDMRDSTKNKAFVVTRTSVGEGTTVDFNNLKVVGTSAADSGWTIVSLGGTTSKKNATVTATGECTYTVNGEAKDFDTYLAR